MTNLEEYEECREEMTAADKVVLAVILAGCLLFWVGVFYLVGGVL